MTMNRKLSKTNGNSGNRYCSFKSIEKTKERRRKPSQSYQKPKKTKGNPCVSQGSIEKHKENQ